ncbi:carotenoid 1,2-hydratase [Bradyrhizobium sediminis]|uniref:carotenoid 1,2-hydratase n=1 Tax=Bradyrhizobium sediminis TaxID=2840469 RepID=UPI002112C5E8|nr:carotenoid 1,2-hydratase [Bradyrhizobium sediminis]
MTANLKDSTGAAYGAQWTLFRQASRPGAQQEGWANQQIWMGHAASPAPTFTAIAKPSPAAASVRPASNQSRFKPGSIPGQCAG